MQVISSTSESTRVLILNSSRPMLTPSQILSLVPVRKRPENDQTSPRALIAQRGRKTRIHVTPGQTNNELVLSPPIDVTD